ncbi:phytanoyl-CoA dioxygenase family protein [Saccharospirillum mangrovi]|uniref:phytanoyl-CoA dioxygenase family protein n=1 Tax=Saccharospirillum mangrovi TaxID=2161747 RepID=UPI000D384E4E|nr:phytanoyl-CoA dioxygenase family protein [Saccharospirillum mangrovi]
MTPEQKSLFDRQGILYLPGALDKGRVASVKTQVLDVLKRRNLWASGRTLSQAFKGVPVFQQTGKLSQLIQLPNLEERLITAALRAAMEQLAERRLKSAGDAQLLISLPHKLDWTLQGLNFHRDVGKAHTTQIPGVQAFVLIDDLAAQGGATLALAGSHRLSEISALASHLGDLARGQAVSMSGSDCSLVEMSGRAGDVYLMDMRLWHTPSVNASKRPRIMATARYLAG